MGQRLNLEIAKNGKTLANAYYHWSGYTSSSIELVTDVLQTLRKFGRQSDVDYAVSLLQATGAGMNDAELQRIREDVSGIFTGIEFEPAINRNEGLIAVTDVGIEATRYWEEARVVVDIGCETINFKAYYDETPEEYLECHGSDLEALQGAANFDFEKIPFAEFTDFARFVEENPNGVKMDGHRIVCWIE